LKSVPVLYLLMQYPNEKLRDYWQASICPFTTYVRWSLSALVIFILFVHSHTNEPEISSLFLECSTSFIWVSQYVQLQNNYLDSNDELRIIDPHRYSQDTVRTQWTLPSSSPHTAELSINLPRATCSTQWGGGKWVVSMTSMGPVWTLQL